MCLHETPSHPFSLFCFASSHSLIALSSLIFASSTSTLTSFTLLFPLLLFFLGVVRFLQYFVKRGA